MIFPALDWVGGDGAIFSRTDVSVVLLMALCEPLFLIAPPAVPLCTLYTLPPLFRRGFNIANTHLK